MPEKFIIKVNYGGLGDHLFYSHLPKIAKTVAGYSKVLVSLRSEFRNPEYKRLVWEMNPFVDGFCQDDAPYPEFGALAPGTNLLDRIMIERGLDDGLRFHEPEVYYLPKTLPGMAGRSVYDPNFVSNVGEIHTPALVRFFAANGGGPDFQLRQRDRCFPVPRAREITTESLYHYCDLIHSCGAFYCLASGGATLAAALGKSSRVFWGYGQLPRFHHSKLHRYQEVSPGKLGCVLRKWSRKLRRWSEKRREGAIPSNPEPGLGEGVPRA